MIIQTKNICNFLYYYNKEYNGAFKVFSLLNDAAKTIFVMSFELKVKIGITLFLSKSSLFLINSINLKLSIPIYFLFLHPQKSLSIKFSST